MVKKAGGLCIYNEIRKERPNVMKAKKLLSALVCASLLAGCSASTTDNSTTDTEDNTTAAETSSMPAALETLKDAADDDDKALEAWTTLLSNAADYYDDNYHIEGSSNFYEYKTADDSSFVDDSFLYKIGRDSVAMSSDSEEYIVDLTDIDNSDNSLEQGYGTIGRFGDDGLVAVITLDATSESELQGKLKSSTTDTKSTDDEIINNMMDTLVNFGYIRNVDPIHDASLYSYEFSQDGDKWVLKLSIKDVEAFQKAAAIKTVLIDDRDDRPVLGLDEVEAETYTFTFDSDGILQSVDNEIFHALSALDDSTYVSIGNKTALSKATDVNLSVSAMKEFLDNVSDGSVADGSEFTIENWK